MLHIHLRAPLQLSSTCNVRVGITGAVLQWWASSQGLPPGGRNPLTCDLCCGLSHVDHWEEVVSADASGSCMLLRHRGILWQRWQAAPQFHLHHASLCPPSHEGHREGQRWWAMMRGNSRLRGRFGEWVCRWCREVQFLNSTGLLIPSAHKVLEDCAFKKKQSRISFCLE